MSQLEPIDPVLESPLINPLFKQRVIAGELVNEVSMAKSAVTGMLLTNMEKNGQLIVLFKTKPYCCLFQPNFLL